MSTETIQIVAYDPCWPQIYLAEREKVLAAVGARFVALEHVGSTAVPGLSAKAIIDMMAAVSDLQDGVDCLEQLAALGYEKIETGMQAHLFLRKIDPEQGCSFHLHIVDSASWPERNERLLRDYLLAHPTDAQAYGQIKQRLALEYAQDGLSYTKAKTSFIQSVMDRARDERGLQRINVWE